MNKYKIGNFITTLRKEKEMTQEQLAEKLDISSKAVSKWETGKCLPETAQLIKMSKVFDVTIDEILYGERVDNPNDIHKEVTEESYTMLRVSEQSLKNTLFLVSAMFILNGLSILAFGLSVWTVVIYVLSLCAILALFLENKKIKSPTNNTKIKNRKIAKIGLIICIATTVVLLVCGIIFDTVLKLKIITTISWWSKIIVYLYAVSIVPAIMYFIMRLINSDYSNISSENALNPLGFDMGVTLILILVCSPIFMIKYYFSTLKLLNN